MVDFSKIVNRGKRRFKSKSDGEWGRCEECDNRKILFIYIDNTGSEWKLCEDCINYYTKEEDK